MDQQLLDLYHRHAGIGFDRQLRFAAFLDRKAPGAAWEYDVPTAALTFGPKLRFEAPVIGSHADHNDSWLWAWSNKHLKLTLTNRALGDAVRALAHRLGVAALAAVGMPLEPLLGDDLTEHAAHVFGLVLGAELGYDAYYLMPYDGGRGLLLVRDDRLKFEEKHPLRRILTVFPQVLSGIPVPDHRAAFTGYADAYGLTAAPVPGGLKLVDGNDSLTATFDDRGRLADLSGTIRPEAPPPKRVAKKKPAKPKATKKAIKKPAAKVAKPAAKKGAKPATKKATKPPAKKPTKAAKNPAPKPGKKR